MSRRFAGAGPSATALRRPALVQIPELAHLVRVWPLLVLARGLEEDREVLQRRVTDEDAELLAHQTVEEVRVAVAVRAERRRRVVDVQRAKPLEPDQLVHPFEHPVELPAVGDVVARRVEMARIEADPQVRMA